MQILAPIIAVAEQARAQAIDAQTPFAAVTPLAQENVRFLDTAFKDTVAGKLADAAERGRRLAILKQVVASRIAAGGLTVTAGGFSLVAGNLVLTSGVRLQANLPSAADDAAAAALSPAVPVGGLYHTAGAVKQRLV